MVYELTPLRNPPRCAASPIATTPSSSMGMRKPGRSNDSALRVRQWSHHEAITSSAAIDAAITCKSKRPLSLLHVIAASIAALLVIASWWLHWRTRRAESLLLPGFRIPIELLGVVAIGLAAHLGGFLSGVNT